MFDLRESGKRRRAGICLLWPAVLLFGALMASPGQAQISDAKVWAFVEALRLAAPNTGIPNDGLYSPWKVKAPNIVRWSKRCLGRELSTEEFDAKPDLAREVVACHMSRVLREQYAQSRNDESVAVRRAAAWWMAGDPEQYDRGSTAAYTERVLRYYRQEAP